MRKNIFTATWPPGGSTGSGKTFLDSLSIGNDPHGGSTHTGSSYAGHTAIMSS